MPLFYQHNINESAKIGIWKIEEEEDFFLERISSGRPIAHSDKRVQHLAGRYLLSVLASDFPLDELRISASRRPFLPRGQYEFSISHCAGYAAAIVSQKKKIGLDIELISSKIEAIKDKFLTERELELAQDIQQLTIFWAAKEAVYKWYGLGGVDFKEHIRLDEDMLALFCKDQLTQLQVNVMQFDQLIIAYVIR